MATCEELHPFRSAKNVMPNANVASSAPSETPSPSITIINSVALAELFARAQGTILGFFDMFSGGALSRLTIFALGIMPYISSSIILQLMTIVSPYLARLKKEGEQGQKKITQYTRYGTVVLSLIQGSGIAVGLEAMKSPSGGLIVPEPGWSFRMMTVLTLTAGTCFLMWLGEQITERGIGNGISIIITSDTIEETIGLSNNIIVMKDGELKNIINSDKGNKPLQIDIIKFMV